ncbi:MAG TPA: type I 3-dehydroquinate dehydratase [Phycisphaerales bacterium]|nr:type I 3-dehydroquinate dehydratase [Phycisphaerales bacterium]
MSIPVREVEQAAGDARAAKAGGADIVEFRVDEFFHGDDATNAAENQSWQLARLVSECPLPCIVTCRHVSEGGHYDGPEDARIALLEHLTRSGGKGYHPPRYVDLELASYERSANLRQKVGLAIGVPGGVGEAPQERSGDPGTSLILSVHDTKGRPQDLTRRLARLYEAGAASVVKVAYRARSLRDSLELLDIAAQGAAGHKPTIALGMGEYGLLSRVLAGKFGAFLTFAALRREDATAPGQPTLDELLNLHRFRSIGAQTAVYGVVGSPVGHSMSPLVHNAGFGAVGHDGVYLPLPVAAGSTPEETDLSLKATLLELLHHERLNVRGLSVTIPFKESIVRLGRAEGWPLDPMVQAIGAANTLVVRRSTGQETGAALYNTDALAARECIEAVVGALAGKHIAVLGAGGVARAVAFACAAAGAETSVFARDVGKAAELSQAVARTIESGLKARPPGALLDAQTTDADVIVNCTPVGMTGGPAPGQSPIPDLSRLKNTAVVFDTVYNPVETPLLRAARARGLATIDGVSLFTRQAEAQFRLWTGKVPPANLFDGLVRERLRTQEA